MALVEYGDIKLDMRKATNADAFRREKCINRLEARFGRAEIDEQGKAVLIASDGMRGYIHLFSRIVTQGKEAINLPFTLPYDPQDADIDCAFDVFMEMDEDFGNKCWSALAALSKASDPAMEPDGLGDNADPNSSSAAKKHKSRGADGGAE